VDRLVDGFSAGVGQLTAYGNAVIPAASERIGRLIVAHFELREVA
jgi:hypothetical protein